MKRWSDSLYIYNDPERRERNQSPQDHDPTRQQERDGGAYRQELLTADFLPVYFESDYRTALAYVSAYENIDFYFLTVDDKYSIIYTGNPYGYHGEAAGYI